MTGTLWRHRDARLLLLGSTAAMAGDSMMLLALPIWARTLTGSPAAPALIMLCLVVPCAAAPLGGWLLDRLPRRRFLIGADLAGAAATLPLLAVRDRTALWVLYAFAAWYGALLAATGAALNGLLKDLLEEELLGTANAALQTVREGLRIAGPPTGAALFTAWGGTAVALADAVAFLAAAACLTAITASPRAAAVADPGMGGRAVSRAGGHAAWSWGRETGAGLRHLTGDPALRRTMTASAIAWLVLGLGEPVSFAVVDRGLHRPAAFIGVLACAQGAGAVAGGLAAAPAVTRAGEMAVLAGGLCAFGGGTALCAVPALPAVLAGKVLAGAGFAAGGVASVTLLQRRTPGPLIGRASTAAEAFTSGPQALSILCGAALITVVDHRYLLAAMTAGMLTAALHLWPRRHLTAPGGRCRGSRDRSERRSRGDLGVAPREAAGRSECSE